MATAHQLKAVGPADATSPEPLPSQPQSGSGKSIFTGPHGLRAGWRLLIFAVMVVGLLGSFLIIRNGGVEGFKQAQRMEGKIVITPLRMGGMEGGAFLLVCLATFVMSKLERRRFGVYGLPFRKALGKDFWAGSIAGLLGVSGTLLVMFLLHGFRITGFALHGTAMLSAMAAWAAAFVVVGLCEEFLTRGYAQYTLASGIGFWPAAVVMSSLFAFGHMFNANESAIGVASVVLFGLLHCFLLQRTGALWCAVGFHAGWDWGQTCLFGVRDSGIAPYHAVLHSATSGPAWLSGGIVGPEASVLTPIALLTVGIIFSRLYRQNLYGKQR